MLHLRTAPRRWRIFIKPLSEARQMSCTGPGGMARCAGLTEAGDWRRRAAG